MNKIIKIVSLFMAIVFTSVSTYKTDAAIKQTTGTVLQNIPVFYEYNDYRNNGTNARFNCTFWGNFESESGIIPLDSTVNNNGEKAYRVNLTGSGGMMFPIHGWGSFSLKSYYENGILEFDIMGSEGGEDFSIGLRSSTRGKETDRTVTLSSANIQVTDSWQHVRLPLKNIIGNPIPESFSIENVNLVIITIPKTQKLYLSEMYITSIDNEVQYPVIKVNQVGYEPLSTKYALVSCFPDTINLSADTDFTVVDSGSEIKYTGKLEPVSKTADKISGEIVYKADFTSLKEEGEYYISINEQSIENSCKFKIVENVYSNLLSNLIKYYYYQRQGTKLTAEYAGQFAREDLHPGDSAVKLYSQINDINAPVYDVSKGWYDAGDFGKYMTSAATTVANLLTVYELFPDLFSDTQTNIPESGNGVPDILDEIKWELDFMLSMQDTETGGFYDLIPNQDPGAERYIFDISGDKTNVKTTSATADACASLANAYIVFKDVPKYHDYAVLCLEAAKKAWDYLENNPAVTWVDGAYKNESNVTGEKFWAAAVMYRATGESKYEEFVLTHYKDSENARSFDAYQVTSYGVNSMSMMGYINYALCPKPDDAFMKYFEEKFKSYESVQMNTYRSNPWKIALVDWAYFWGSSGPICLIPVTIYLGNMVLDRDMTQSVELLKNSVHYMLGINPLSFSFVSGNGENSVKNIFSGIYTYDGIDAVPSGYVAGGANQYDSGFMSKFVSKCYVDSDREWTTNEHAIYWNAAMIFCLSAAMSNIEINNIETEIIEEQIDNSTNQDINNKDQSTSHEKQENSSETPNDTNDSNDIIILLIIIAAVVIASGIFLFIKFKKKK